MDWTLFTQLIAFFVAAFGWWAAHYFSRRRDLANERRKLRVSYLLEAYRKLESASHSKDLKQWPNIISAIADIQLLGSAHQVSLAQQFAVEMAKSRTASLDELILDLRQTLRSELELEPVGRAVKFLRIDDGPQDKSH